MHANYTVVMSEPLYLDLTYADLKRWMVEVLLGHLDGGVRRQEDQVPRRRGLVARAYSGGEACLWSERIDASVLWENAFPDLSAIAENLWLGGETVTENNWRVVREVQVEVSPAAPRHPRLAH